MPASLPAPCISLNTAAVLTGRSVRTWQRRIEEGLVPRLGEERGRALVAFDAVRPALALKLDEPEVDLLVRADQGDAAAQAEVGALFALAALDEAKAAAPANAVGGSAIPALHFLTRAAEQGQADAMHWLGLLHAAGLGESGDGDALALMWVARAAAHGHAIAVQQVAALLPAAV
ncbi:MAG: sel1 repeat family protein [Proteobacteria bacterium]|nr:sel1 repeat family protein [Pseudomonadota bacterium]